MNQLHKPDRWRRALLIALSGSLMLIILVGLGRHFWGATQENVLNDTYRYRFERPAAGVVTRALEDEIAFYQTRIQRDPKGGLDLAALAATYLKLARASGEMHWYVLAEETAQRSLAHLAHDNMGARLVLARVAEARHDFPSAIHLLESLGANVDALGIRVTSYLAMGRLSEADLAATTLVDVSPSLGSYTLRALVRLAQGKETLALEDFSAALSLEEPGETASSMWTRTLLGRFYAKRGQSLLAKRLYSEVLRVLPQYQFAIVQLAELELRLGHYTEAWNWYSKIFVIAKGNPTVFDHAALRGMARIKRLQGALAEAHQTYERAAALMRRDLTHFGHRRELARLLLERGQVDDLPEVLSLLQEEIKVRRDAETLDAYAWGLSRTGQWVEAKNALMEALAHGARDPVLFYRLAMIEQHLGNVREARYYFKLVADTDPTFDEQARNALGLGL